MPPPQEKSSSFSFRGNAFGVTGDAPVRSACTSVVIPIVYLPPVVPIPSEKEGGRIVSYFICAVGQITLPCHFLDVQGMNIYIYIYSENSSWLLFCFGLPLLVFFFQGKAFMSDQR